MDINDVRGYATILVMIAFFGVCWWAFAPRRKQRFNEDANLPFADEAMHEKTQESESSACEKQVNKTSVKHKQD